LAKGGAQNSKKLFALSSKATDVSGLHSFI